MLTVPAFRSIAHAALILRLYSKIFSNSNGVSGQKTDTDPLPHATRWGAWRPVSAGRRVPALRSCRGAAGYGMLQRLQGGAGALPSRADDDLRRPRCGERHAAGLRRQTPWFRGRGGAHAGAGPAGDDRAGRRPQPAAAICSRWRGGSSPDRDDQVAIGVPRGMADQRHRDHEADEQRRHAHRGEHDDQRRPQRHRPPIVPDR